MAFHQYGPDAMLALPVRSQLTEAQICAVDAFHPLNGTAGSGLAAPSPPHGSRCPVALAPESNSRTNGTGESTPMPRRGLRLDQERCDRERHVLEAPAVDTQSSEHRTIYVVV